MEDLDLNGKINQLQKTYYETHGKNVVFKNGQKQKCAEYLAEQLDVNILVEKTARIIPNTNCVFLDYMVFKIYAHETIYERTVECILNLISECINKYGSFEVHINLKSFTISAAQRYLEIIKLFCNRCLQSNTRYASYITKMVIYNTPSMIDGISRLLRPFINDYVRERLDLVKGNHGFPPK